MRIEQHHSRPYRNGDFPASTSALTGHGAGDCAGAVKNFRAHLLLHTFGFCGAVPLMSEGEKMPVWPFAVGFAFLLLVAGILFFFIHDKGEKKGQLANISDNNGTVAKPVKELTLEERVIGEYEVKKSAKHVLLGNGKSETWILGVKRHGGTWKIVGKEVHVGIEKLTHVYKIEPNGDLTLIANISDGKQTDVLKENQYIWEKIK